MTVALPVHSAAINTTVLKMESSHTLPEEIITTPVIDISTTAISATRHVTPSSKNIEFNTTSTPSVKTTAGW